MADLSLGIWHVYFGPIGINMNAVLLGLFVLILAMAKRFKGKQTKLFEVSFLLFLTGFLYLTLHGGVLQYIFPVSLPEKPLVDNNLTFNYALTSVLTFLVFPVLFLVLFKSDVSLEKVGLKIQNHRQTVLYALIGVIFSIFLYLASYSLFGSDWVGEYTLDGLVFWVLFVTILSVFAQTFFFNDILFGKYSHHENGFLLAAISILAFQMFMQTTLPWIATNIVSSAAKIVVTWKTRSVYGSVLMGVVTNLIEISIQI